MISAIYVYPRSPSAATLCVPLATRDIFFRFIYTTNFAWSLTLFHQPLCSARILVGRPLPPLFDPRLYIIGVPRVVAEGRRGGVALTKLVRGEAEGVGMSRGVGDVGVGVGSGGQAEGVGGEVGTGGGVVTG